MIAFRNVSFQYDGKREYALKKINLTIHKGETILLLGKSGSGKSTLLSAINGIIPNHLAGTLSGQVSLNGEELSSTGIQELSKQVGSVFQNPKSQFFNINTTDELLFGLMNHRESPERMKERLAATTAGLNMENLLNREIFHLSGGEKQKVACAAVYMTDTDIVLFDEPSSNLDADAIEDLREVIDQLKKEGKTILIAEHRVYYLMSFVDRIVYMDYGEIKKIMTTKELTDLSEKEREAMGIRSLVAPVLHDKLRERHFEIGGPRKADLYINNFSYAYKHGEVLWHIPECQCTKGEIIGIMGRNGVGKTTLAYAICGILKGKGEIKRSPSGKSIKARQRRRCCSMVMQDVNHQLFLDTVWKELLFLSQEDADWAKAKRIAEELDLSAYLEAHPLSLSGGQKQRVVIASALMDGKEIIIFDEPTSGLDLDSMNKVATQVQRIANGRIIFVISHDIEFINKICTRILFLSGHPVKDETKNERFRDDRHHGALPVL
ncbi:MAG: ABC transporter ATP-binding protein [Eubacteriales bacterium]|nr:ABC transporter ATP-binding protein [Eubacteriales bacterium]